MEDILIEDRVQPCAEAEAEAGNTTLHPTVDQKNTAKRWSQTGNIFTACEKALDQIPAGYYLVDSNASIGYFLRQQTLNFDDLVDGLNDDMDFVIDDMERFFNSKAKYQKYGFL